MNFIKPLMGALKKTTAKKGPEILIGLGLVLLVGTVHEAMGADLKAEQALEELEETQEEVQNKEIIKALVPIYLPIVGMTIATGACFIFAHRIHARRNAAILALYKLSQDSLHSYEEAAIKTVGPNNVKKIKDKFLTEKIDKNVSDTDIFEETGMGDQLFLDLYSGRKFKCSKDAIDRTINDLNARLNVGDRITLNDIYDGINMEGTLMGEYAAWEFEDPSSLIRIHWGSTNVGPRKLAVTTFQFTPSPTWLDDDF